MEATGERWWHLGAERHRWNRTRTTLEKINREVLAEQVAKTACTQTVYFIVPEGTQVGATREAQGTVVDINLQPEPLAS